MKQIICIICFIFSPALWAEDEQNFTLQTAWFSQPLDHQSPSGEQFQQQYFVLTPSDIGITRNVLFILGNENDATPARLTKIYNAYGSPQDMVFVLAEHRGYGQSTYGESQQKPKYISLDNAVADYAALVKHLRKTFTDKWAVSGCSYGGSVSIRYAQLHPDTYDVAISSSGVLDYPALMDEYAEKVNESLEPQMVARLAEHLAHLYQNKDDVEAIRQTELVHTLIIGMTQVGTMQHLIPLTEYLSYLPTSMFVWLLDQLLPVSAHNWANGQSQAIVPSTPETRNWFTWKYQQCYQTGTFMVGYPFSLTKDDYAQRCAAAFGEQPPYFSAPMASYADSLAQVTQPIIVISGGKDPWINLGVQPDHIYTNIDYLYDDNWHHCPDKDTPAAASQLMQKIRQYFGQ